MNPSLFFLTCFCSFLPARAKSRLLSIGRLAFIAVALVLFLALSACSKNGGTAKDPNVDYYTCTMHPSVRSQDPHGKCPICSMDLVPVLKKGQPAPAAHHEHTAVPTADVPSTPPAALNEFSVPVERQQQIGVTYASVERKHMRHTMRSVGMVAPDKAREWQFVARVDGYVQKLNVTSPGETVEQDQPLLTIYSPELFVAERELIDLLVSRDRASTPDSRTSAERLLAAARHRLEQWNITAKQVAELEKTRQPSEVLVLHSPFRGVVEEVPVDQGRKVSIGDHLVNVANLSVVWVWAEFYEDELPMLEKGEKVSITTKSYPGESFEGELSLINPFLVEMKRTVKVRVDIPNPEFKLRPGMYVDMELNMDMGEGLTIPVSAVMPTGARALVFVDKGEGKLEPRAVQIGRQFNDIYEIKGGLKEGERVVTSANFLIDAESKVQGAVKNFEGETERQGDVAPPVAPAAHIHGQHPQ